MFTNIRVLRLRSTDWKSSFKAVLELVKLKAETLSKKASNCLRNELHLGKLRGTFEESFEASGFRYTCMASSQLLEYADHETRQKWRVMAISRY